MQYHKHIILCTVKNQASKILQHWTKLLRQTLIAVKRNLIIPHHELYLSLPPSNVVLLFICLDKFCRKKLSQINVYPFSMSKSQSKQYSLTTRQKVPESSIQDKPSFITPCLPCSWNTKKSSTKFLPVSLCVARLHEFCCHLQVQKWHEFNENLCFPDWQF